MSWRREVLKTFNRVETCAMGHPAAFYLLATGACAARADKACGSCSTQREKDKQEAWQPLIGQRNFYLILSLNSIISLQTNFLFFIFIPKFMIFFSL
jgi:hypothetical protein